MYAGTECEFVAYFSNKYNGFVHRSVRSMWKEHEDIVAEVLHREYEYGRSTFLHSSPIPAHSRSVESGLWLEPNPIDSGQADLSRVSSNSPPL